MKMLEKKNNTVQWVAIALAAFIAFSWFNYNGLVSQEEMVKTRWADVEVQYQRRMDLIPNIVETVKGAANYEKEAYQGILDARNSWAHAKTSGDINGQIEAANSLEARLPRFMAVIERYPNLQVTAHFKELRVELEGTENRIAVARRDFNQAVRKYNVKVRQFPTVMLANTMGFKPWRGFEAQTGAENAPKVKF